MNRATYTKTSSSKNWIIRQKGYDPGRTAFYESLFSQGNGYMGIRGFSGDMCRREKYEKSTFIAGVYDDLKPGVTDFVNTPNYVQASMVFNGSRFSPDDGQVEGYEQKLDMRDGTLTKKLVWKDEAGRRTYIRYIRFLSIESRHHAVERYEIKPLNWSGPILFEAAIDSGVENLPVNDDQLKKNNEPVVFLEYIDSGATEENVYFLQVKTDKTELLISEAFMLAIFMNNDKMAVSSTPVIREDYAAQRIMIDAVQDGVYTIDKFISVYTSRELEREKVKDAAIRAAKTASHTGFERMLRLNREVWSQKWEISDVQVEGDDSVQLAIRYNIFCLIQGNAEDDPYVSIGARGLTHGRYKGCYFWDTEIFMLPFFIYTNPKAARNLLKYRYNTLSGAKANAKEMSLDGARYAWMCSTDGREQCETWDTGCCEVHITADVSYAVNHYCEATGDTAFIRDYGAEILIQTSRYWKSRFSYDESKDVYNMLFVKGPDEYCGVTANNTFTTMMAVHNLKLAVKAIGIMKSEYTEFWKKLAHKTSFQDCEIKAWTDIIRKAVINYDPERKLYIEDDLFEKLEPFNPAQNKTGFRPLYYSIAFDRLQRLKVLKQADIIQMMILLPDQFSEEEKHAAWNYYEPLTLHDSTLSFGSHALFAARLGRMEKACDYFTKSVRLDLDDVMSNTGAEGLHYAALGVSWQAVVMGFGGVSIQGGIPVINPHLPDSWKQLKFRLNLKGHSVGITITKDQVSIHADSGLEGGNLSLCVCGENIELSESSTCIVIKSRKSNKLKRLSP